MGGLKMVKVGSSARRTDGGADQSQSLRLGSADQRMEQEYGVKRAGVLWIFAQPPVVVGHRFLIARRDGVGFSGTGIGSGVIVL